MKQSITKRLLSIALAAALLLPMLLTNSLADGGAVISDKLDFDVLLTVDPGLVEEMGIEPLAFAGKIGGYLDKLIEAARPVEGSKSYRIIPTASKLDATDLSQWYVYDHYDTAFYANEQTWTENYAKDRGESGLPQNWFYSAVTDGQAVAANTKKTVAQLVDDKYNSGTNGTTWGKTGSLREHIYSYMSGGKPAMQFYGYGTAAHADFLYYPASTTSTKYIGFNLNAAEVQPHSLSYAGVLINGGVKDGLVNGYLVLFAYGPTNSSGGKPATSLTSTSLYKLTNANVSSLHSGGIASITSADNIKKVAVTGLSQTSDFWPYSRIELEITTDKLKATIQKTDASGNLVSGDGNTKELFTYTDGKDYVPLDDTKYGGFGPYVDYAGHNCGDTSSFLYSMLDMEFKEPSSSSSILESYQYANFVEDCGERFFINLTGDKTYAEASSATDDDKVFANLLRQDGTTLLTDEAGGFAKTYLGDNCKNYADMADSAISDICSSNDQYEKMAAKLAKLIYDVQFNPESGSDPGTAALVPSLKLKDALDTEEVKGNQVNQVRKEMTGSGLAVYLDTTGSQNVGNATPVFSLKKPDGTEAALTPQGDGYFLVKNSSNWPAGEYTVTLKYNMGDGTFSLPSQAKFSVISDNVAPTPSITASAAELAAHLSFVNNPSALGGYTSDLASYAVVFNSSATKPTVPEDTDFIAILNNASTATVAFPTLTLGSSYYAHVFLKDAAGNMGYAMDGSFTMPATDQKTQTLSDPGVIVIEVEPGKSSDRTITVTNRTDFTGIGAAAPNPLVTYDTTGATDNATLTANDDGSLTISPTPKKYGDFTFKAKAEETNSHLAVERTITVRVIEPLSASFGNVNYTRADGVITGVNFTPNVVPGGYGLADATLKYRPVGSSTWKDILPTAWDIGKEYPFAIDRLTPDTDYEILLTATDKKENSPRVATATLTFHTPKTGGSTPIDPGTGAIKVVITDPTTTPGTQNLSPAIKKNDVYVVTIKDGDKVLDTITHVVTAEDAAKVAANKPNDPFVITVPDLPEGSYTVVVESTPDNTGVSGNDVRPPQKTTGQVVVSEDSNAPAAEVAVSNDGHAKNTEVTLIDSSTPKVGVQGLDEIFKALPVENSHASEGLTSGEITLIMAPGSSSIIELQALGVPEDSDEFESEIADLKALDSGRTTAMLLDLTLWKKIMPKNEADIVQQLEQSPALLTIYVPLGDAAGKEIQISRVHNGSADILPQGEEKKNNDGEYWEYVDASKDAVYLHVRMFSLYHFSVLADTGVPDSVFWSDVERNIENASPGATVTVNANDRGSLPAAVIDALRERDDVTLVIKRNGREITIPAGKAPVTPEGKTEWTFDELIRMFLDGAQLNKTDHLVFIRGKETGHFDAGASITRAEVAAMFARLTVGFEEGVAYPSSYSDVPAGLWYSGYIGFLESHGIITGYTDGTFRPNAPITRAEFVAIATRYEDCSAAVGTGFADVPSSHWAASGIAFAFEKGWITGYTDGSFRPDSNISRIEAVTIVCRELDRVIDERCVEGCGYKEFPDVSKDYWGYYFVLESASEHDFTREGGREIWTK